MRIEFLSTGNELLDGSVVDTNAAWFMQRAFALGVPVARKETLPDDLPAIAAAMHAIGARADFVVVSGGLGPTRDDLTAEAAAVAAGAPLETDEAILAHLRERYARRGFVFSENNARQARVPRGHQAILNPFGSAPMLVVRIGRADFHLLPGVPREFRGLCEREVLPRLESRLAVEPGRVFRASRVLKTVGLPESQLDTRVAPLPERHPHVRFGFRTHAPENHLKLLAEAPTPEEARARLAAAEQEARALIGEPLFGADDEELAGTVIAALREAGATVALAESCTGGMCASLLASVPGASEVLVSSAVVYQDRAKSDLLGLDEALVRREGAVSAIVTRALAEAARERAGATYGLAVTGWAGPGGGTERDPVGTIYLCLASAAGAPIESRHHFGTDRERVRTFASYTALDVLRRRAREARP